MFSRQFWLDAGEAFALAVVVVVVTDAEALVAAGSWEQAATVGVALARAAVLAGLRAVAPRLLAEARSRQEV